MANTVALGAALGLTGYDREILNQILRETFAGGVGESNVKAAAAGYDYAKQNFKGKIPPGKSNIKPVSDVKRLLLNGTDAIALGAIAAGCKFLAGYPMTPTTPIIEYLASKEKEFGLVVVQAGRRDFRDKHGRRCRLYRCQGDDRYLGQWFLSDGGGNMPRRHHGDPGCRCPRPASGAGGRPAHANGTGRARIFYLRRLRRISPGGTDSDDNRRQFLADDKGV